MWPYPKIVAHRGGGTMAPENTLAGIRCGLSYGFRAVEFDVMLSSDGVPILMHDPVFGRTVRGMGKVEAFTAAQLSAMDAGSWFGSAFSGVRVCTFAQAIAFCRQHGVWMNVEIKPVEGYEVETGHVVAQMTQACFVAEVAAHIAAPSALTAANLPLLSSFSMEALRAAQVAAGAIPRACLMSTIADNWLQRCQEVEAVSVHTNHKFLSPVQATTIKESGYGLFCYTVNSLKRAGEILAWGVDGFCTDRIDLIAADLV
ncbi:glycerophosphodiester phosphodiesterase [Glaciimonas immobilis]|uniref:Glycerophosphoryl diester phosphodiesterase n=1 Tax=Glaciimonas immobilis TaxID=728004 RepID=A0A840RR89_9BURK|nr:glycerophosphodiester phosphodiesterase [Glaciimonas immobilis]KAF3997863.1 glycerophosphodiester phosphodiesterase [Glaciimonas immobilis]MBB5199496.1 glycerophosphoryl diester phosphodiesterase [Glaciimonas immobilis]